MKFLFSLLFFFYPFIVSYAQDSTATQVKLFESHVDDILSLKKEESQDVKTSVASVLKAVDVRETPAIVTVITQEQIQRSGARDLIDLFWLVPGLDIVNDFGNTRFLAIRGQSAEEGKILLLLDGHIMTETNYGAVPIGQRFPLGWFERIEIIRGPGSSIYGGTAGLCVVNLITKKGNSNKKNTISSTYEHSLGRTQRVASDFLIGREIKKDFYFSIGGAFSSANLSNRLIKRPNEQVSYADSSAVKSAMFKADLHYKKLNINFLAEDYRLQRTESNDKLTVFNGYYLYSDYTINIGTKTQVVPYLRLKIQEPWNVIGPRQSDFNELHKQAITGVKALVSLTSSTDITLGTENIYTNAKLTKENSSVTYFKTGNKTFTMNNFAVFAEISQKTKYANFSLGGRADVHTTAGAAVVPRVGIAKAFDKWNYKIIYSQAFKTPSTANINYIIDSSKNTLPERIEEIDVEIGYRPSKHFAITANYYRIKVADFIAFVPSNSLIEGSYTNDARVGTQGVEVEATLTYPKFILKTSYSYYIPTFREVEELIVPENSKVMQGLSPHKITMQTSWEITKNIRLNTTGVFLSSKSNYIPNALDVPTLDVTPNYMLVNSNVYWSNIIKNVDLQLGVYNLLNTDYNYGLAYITGMNYLPGQARSFQLKALFRLE